MEFHPSLVTKVHCLGVPQNLLLYGARILFIKSTKWMGAFVSLQTGQVDHISVSSCTIIIFYEVMICNTWETSGKNEIQINYAILWQPLVGLPVKTVWRLQKLIPDTMGTSRSTFHKCTMIYSAYSGFQNLIRMAGFTYKILNYTLLPVSCHGPYEHPLTPAFIHHQGHFTILNTFIWKPQ